MANIETAGLNGYDDVALGIAVVAYETLYGRPIFPASVMRDMAEDIPRFTAAREIKDFADAFEWYEQLHADRPHIVAFLRCAFKLVESAGVDYKRAEYAAQACERAALDLIPVTNRVYGRCGDVVSPGQLATRIWQEYLDQAYTNT